MTTRWEEGDIITSFGPQGLDCDIFDVVDEEGKVDVLIYFPQDTWLAATDEDDELELINEYSYPGWCITTATWEEAPDDADADDDQICIRAQIQFDLTD